MTVKPAIYNDFVIYQGASFQELLNFKDSQDSNIDLTGFTARMKIKKSYSDDVSIVELSTENSGITMSELNGNLTLLISATDTASLNSGVYVYDLELVTGSVVHRYMQGSIAVSAEVTK